jgi:hypothetical protein
MNTKNPYPGLRAFEFEESHLFFGREGQSEELLSRLQRNHFVAVVGTSGSGKSSFVKAGLLPLLYGGFMADAGANWRISIFRPGKSPIKNLATTLVCPTEFETQCPAGAKREFTHEEKLKITVTETILRRSSVGLLDYANGMDFDAEENLLIVVDQFEELFRFRDKCKSVENEATQTSADDEAAAFVKLLLEATRDKSINSRIYIVITMRSDFLGDCAQFRNLPETINDDGQYLIPRLMRDQLRRVIEAPAKVHRVQMTPALVTRLLNDIGDDQDQLPVLQHALMRTWQNWREEPDTNVPLDISHYEESGGMANALSIHANKAYGELKKPEEKFPSQRQIIAEKLFKCLTVLDNENREVRRATTLGNICTVVKGTADYTEEDFKEVVSVVNAFRRLGRTFLMPPYTVELERSSLLDISHESLIRKWDKLKSWVDEEAKWAHLYRRLVEDAYAGTNFWGGSKLKDILEWREKFKPNETWARLYYENWGQEELADFDTAMKFLDESKRLEEEEIAEKERSRKKLERTARILYASVAALFIVLLFSIGLTVYAFQQRQSVKLLLDKQRQATEEIAQYNKQNYETALQFKELNEKLIGETKKAEDAKNSLQKTYDELQETNDSLNDKTDQLEKNKTELQAAFIKQKEATELAQSEKEKAEKSEKAKQEALLKQEKLAADAERESAKFERMATREKLSRDGLTSLEKGQTEHALKQFNDLLANYRTDKEIEPKEKTEGEWWALHNLGTINWEQKDFAKSEENYVEALRTLGEKEEQIKKLTQIAQKSAESTKNVFQKVSYQKDDETHLENENKENKESKMTTLQRMGRMFRYRAANAPNNAKFVEFNHRAALPYLRLLEILGADNNSPYTASVNAELADVYFDLTYNDIARGFYQKALNILGKNSGAQKFYSIIAVENKLAKLDLREKKFDEAKNRIRKIIDIRLQDLQFSLYHPDLASNYKELGEIYLAESSDLEPDTSTRAIQVANQSIKPPTTNQPQTNDQIRIEKLKARGESYIELSRSIVEWNEENVAGTKDFYSYVLLADGYIAAGECKKAEILFLEAPANKDEGDGMKLDRKLTLARFYKDIMFDEAKAKERYVEISDELVNPNFSIKNLPLSQIKDVGDYFYDIRDYARAEKIFNRILAEKGEKGIADDIALTVSVALNMEGRNALKAEVNAVYEKAVAQVRAKMAKPNTSDIRSLEFDLADILTEQAEYNFRQNDKKTVQNILAQTIPIYAKYFTFSSKDADSNWYEEYSYCLYMLGELKKAEGKNAEALALFEQAQKASDIFERFMNATDQYPLKVPVNFYNKRIVLIKSWASLLDAETGKNKLSEIDEEKKNIDRVINEAKEKCNPTEK